MFVKLARGWWSDTFVRVVGRPHGGDPTRDVGVADCRWQSFCDLTESADEMPSPTSSTLALLARIDIVPFVGMFGTSGSQIAGGNRFAI